MIRATLKFGLCVYGTNAYETIFRNQSSFTAIGMQLNTDWRDSVVRNRTKVYVYPLNGKTGHSRSTTQTPKFSSSNEFLVILPGGNSIRTAERSSLIKIILEFNSINLLFPFLSFVYRSRRYNTVRKWFVPMVCYIESAYVAFNRSRHNNQSIWTII